MIKEIIFNALVRSFYLISALLVLSCKGEPKHAEGKRLAEIHCASCHLFPEPKILPRKVWSKNILPNMGLKMGISHGPLYAYGDANSSKNLNPILDQEDWNKIVHYYINTSENKIPLNPIIKLEQSQVFKAFTFTYDSIPLVSLTTYNEKNGHLLLGDANSNSILTIDGDGEILKSDSFNSPPVKFLIKDSINYILSIGNLSPSDEAKGELKIGNNTIDSLIRPVDFLVHDLNDDGNDDVFICNYGNNIGDFSIYENQGNGSFKKNIIYPLSGAIKVLNANIDDDETDEIIVLFAQEHELLMAWDFENSKFIGQKLAQFQPAFGSVDFELKDMDLDGDLDIILGNGDNSDFSTVLKNFHGIRVLINNGNYKFTERYFYPMHGVSKLRVEDFDLDGDMDIIAISNFGDFTNPNFRSVQLLINEGNLRFKAYSIKNLPDFRWQTIDVSDFDKDGDLDVFIGSFNLNIGPKESDISEFKKIAWVRLENKSK